MNLKQKKAAATTLTRTHMATLTLTITDIPDEIPPGDVIRLFASIGEAMALDANGSGPEHPSPQAWRRAAISASQIIAVAREGRVSLDLLIALIAGNSDPARDNTTPQRTKLIHHP